MTFIYTRESARRIQLVYILDDLEDGEKTNGEIYFIFGKTERERQNLFFNMGVCEEFPRDFN